MVDKTLQQISKEWEDMKGGEVLSKVLMIKERITSRPVNEWTLDGLVDHVFTLTKIMDNLSELKDEASLTVEVIEEEYDAQVRSTYLSIKDGEGKVTDAVAKAMAEQEAQELAKDLIKARYFARLLSDLYKDSERLISYTQTKIKSMTDSSIRSNFSGT